MASQYFKSIFTLMLVCVFVYSFPSVRQKRVLFSFEQDSHSRLKRQSPILGYKNYMQTAAQPSVIVNGGNGYRVPEYSYGVPNTYAAQGSSYGANRAPTVVVNMPDDNYITPIANNPYVLQSRRL
ncbi:uncharacterized protein LOC124632415 isoform X2 [Helicoverpa zea]|uniref:uncharacterized protein LOC124632415 isoform X2 n=1 Tax=Helicoverpa zea TaxID=7113 RepID=UPI001F564780|nr:uncharacterized protein LOC124632415 isoform X2 [Helicoverpa zea]